MLLPALREALADQAGREASAVSELPQFVLGQAEEGPEDCSTWNQGEVMSTVSKPYRPDPEKGCCEFHVFGTGECTCAVVYKDVIDPCGNLRRIRVERGRRLEVVMGDGVEAAIPKRKRPHGLARG